MTDFSSTLEMAKAADQTSIIIFISLLAPLAIFPLSFLPSWPRSLSSNINLQIYGK